MHESPVNARPAEQSSATDGAGQAVRYPGTPRWVKMGASVTAVVVVLVIVVMILSGGEHGPLRHVPSAAGMVTTGSIVAML